MQLETIADRIYYVIFDTRKELCTTMLRFQLYYESPKFYGKIFSLDDLEKWHAEKGRVFYENVSGFNIPEYALTPFHKGAFDPLSEQEKEFLELFKGVHEKFYIIATDKFAEQRVVFHEIAHALFYLDKVYRKKALRILLALPQKTRIAIEDYLRYCNYATKTMKDEMQAYIISDGNAFNLDLSLAQKKLKSILLERLMLIVHKP